MTCGSLIVRLVCSPRTSVMRPIVPPREIESPSPRRGVALSVPRAPRARTGHCRHLRQESRAAQVSRTPVTQPEGISDDPARRPTSTSTSNAKHLTESRAALRPDAGARRGPVQHRRQGRRRRLHAPRRSAARWPAGSPNWPTTRPPRCSSAGSTSAPRRRTHAGRRYHIGRRHVTDDARRADGARLAGAAVPVVLPGQRARPAGRRGPAPVRLQRRRR